MDELNDLDVLLDPLPKTVDVLSRMLMTERSLSYEPAVRLAERIRRLRPEVRQYFAKKYLEFDERSAIGLCCQLLQVPLEYREPWLPLPHGVRRCRVACKSPTD
jgi:hypothetical protein